MAAPAQSFLAAYQPQAELVSARTGLPWQVIWAQWADETGYGTSPAFVDGHNYAGVSPGGNVAYYPDPASGLAAYISTISQPLYASVRNAAANGPVAAAQALGASPWAGSHYDAHQTGAPGADLVAIMRANGLITPSDVAASQSNLTADWWNVLGPVQAYGAATGAAGSVASTVVSDLIAAVRKPALLGVGLVMAAALTIGGIYTAVKPQVDQTKEKAGQAAETAALLA